MAILDVFKIAKTDGFKVPAGPTSDRIQESSTIRTNTELGRLEYTLDGTKYVAVGQGATGGGTDTAFVENDHLITANYTIGQNSMVSCTFDSVLDAVNWSAHGLIQNQMVFFKTLGTLPPELLIDTGYYIKTVLSPDAFTLSATLGGTVINISTIGAGTHTVGKIKNAVSSGNQTIATGVDVIIPTGSNWTIV